MAPSAVLHGDDLFMVIGTPGSFGILETTPQMICNVLDHGFSIQATIEAPRFRTYEGTILDSKHASQRQSATNSSPWAHAATDRRLLVPGWRRARHHK